LDPKWFWRDWQIQPSLLLSVEVGLVNPVKPRPKLSARLQGSAMRGRLIVLWQKMKNGTLRLIDFFRLKISKIRKR
jgi:hypothetical protein